MNSCWTPKGHPSRRTWGPSSQHNSEHSFDQQVYFLICCKNKRQIQLILMVHYKETNKVIECRSLMVHYKEIRSSWKKILGVVYVPGPGRKTMVGWEREGSGIGTRAGYRGGGVESDERSRSRRCRCEDARLRHHLISFLPCTRFPPPQITTAPLLQAKRTRQAQAHQNSIWIKLTPWAGLLSGIWAIIWPHQKSKVSPGLDYCRPKQAHFIFFLLFWTTSHAHLIGSGTQLRTQLNL